MIERDFRAMREFGIDVALTYVCGHEHKAFYRSRVLPEVGGDILQTLLEVGRKVGMEVQATVVVMNCTSEKIQQEHPDWYQVNRNGVSCLTQPPYIPGYRWLCPTRKEVRDYLARLVGEIAEAYDVAGVHLDYIRYPDVILPVGIQPRYGLVQDREFPEYDFCYCDRCREAFRRETGVDPLSMEEEGELREAWRSFRQKTITRIVGELGQVVRGYGKLLTAAVFATPELARRYVRQDWPNWDLDAAMPMIYNNYYGEGLDWIGRATKEGVDEVTGCFPLFTGMQMDHVPPERLEEAVTMSMEAGASGVAIFCYGNSTQHREEFRKQSKGA
jgi:uncharacterized lipoprotein YddW (UPF0748 family)